MPLVLGIEGGGTKTTAALSNCDRVLATHTAAGCNLNRVPAAAVQSALAAAIHGALSTAGASAADVECVCAGVAGAASPEIAAKIQQIISALLPNAAIQVVGDLHIALEAEFRGGPGVVCISGTGSVAFGRNERGEISRAGGWGRLVSDEGSGYWIGQRALSESIHALDEGRPCTLVSRIFEHWQLSTPEQLAQRCHRDPPPNFAELVPLVLAASRDEDPLACEILAAAGARLARVAQLVIRRLWPHPATQVAITGGVFHNSAHVREAFAETLRREHADVSVRLSQHQPYTGALFLAQRAIVGGTLAEGAAG